MLLLMLLLLLVLFLVLLMLLLVLLMLLLALPRGASPFPPSFPFAAGGWAVPHRPSGWGNLKSLNNTDGARAGSGVAQRQRGEGNKFQEEKAPFEG